MAFEKPVLIQSFTAASDMSAASQQYILVKQVQPTSGGDLQCCPCTTTADFVIGVLQNNPERGEQARVMMLGISKVRVASTDIASVTAAFLGVDATSRAVVLTPGTSTVSFVLGRVLHYDATDNDAALVTAAVNCINLNRAI